MTYPLLSALQEANIPFTCFGHSSLVKVFSAAGFSLIGNKHIRDRKWLSSQYRNGSYTHALLCPSSLSAYLPAKLAGIPTVGQHPFCGVRTKKISGAHRVEHYYELGRHWLGDAILSSENKNFIPIDSASLEIAEKHIAKLVDGSFVAVCPYAKNLHKGRNKEWPDWKPFIDDYNAKPLLALVAPEDEARCKSEYPNLPVVSTELLVTAAIMCRADYVLTNDSGAMHLGAHFGASVVGLLGITDHLETRPWYGSYLVGDDRIWPSIDQLLRHLHVAFVRVGP